MKTRTVVEFEDYHEAARFLAKYAGCGCGTDAYRALAQEFPDMGSESEAIEAVKVLAAHFGVTLPADPAKPEPTYISGSTPGKVYNLRTMPTRYIQNVLRMDMFRQGVGLRREMMAELERRTDRDRRPFKGGKVHS